MKRNNSRVACLCAAALVAVAGAPIHAQNQHSSNDRNQQSPPRDQKQFISGALDANQMIVRASQFARRNATHPAVRQLAEALASDHSKAHQQLQAIAQEQNITDNNKTLQPRHQQELNRLKSLGGSDIDKWFVRMVIRDHKRDLVMLQKRRNTYSEGSALDRLIEEELPMVRRHLRMAQAASRQLHLALEDPEGPYARRDPDQDPGDFDMADWGLDFQENDGEVLGLPTSNEDGTILGWLPAPSRAVEAGSRESYIARELADGDVDSNIENVWQADQRPVGAPATAQREQSASRFVSRQEIPNKVRNALRNDGWDANNTRIRRLTVFEAEADGERVYVTENGTLLKRADQ